MKIPLVWLKDYLEVTKSPREIAADFTAFGLMLDKPIGKDNVLDLEQRLNRSDLLSLIGCARDLSAFEDLPLHLPKGYNKTGKAQDASSKIAVKVTTPAVRRFQTRVFKGVKVAPSPKWLAERLSLYGIESKNNIVDITNYVMVEYGQPLHAQDTAKLKGRDITIRNAKAGEVLTTLLGTEVKLDKDAFVLTSGGEVTVLGGIVGGKNTGVTDTTKDIVLDSGNYDSRLIRKVSRKLKILNESVSHNDKFLDPRLIDVALDRATSLILEIAGGEYYANDDYYPNPVKPATQTLRLSRLQLLSGMDLTLGTAKKILKSLGYAVVEEGEGELTVEIPYYRTDVEVEDDLIGDILRIYNYTNIPVHPLSTPVPIDLTPVLYRFEERLRDLLVAQGAHEHITSSLVTSSGKQDQVVLVNALTTDQNALRDNLDDGLSHVLSVYKKHKHIGVTVFEIGKVFARVSGKYLESYELTVTGEGDQRSSLATLLSSLGILNYQINAAQQILIGTKVIGSLTPTSYTLNTESLLTLAKNYTGIVSEFSHTTSLDLSLLAPSSLLYADIVGVINSLKGRWVSLACKSMTKLKDGNNYLITVSWPGESKSVESDKVGILTALKEKLKITSKS